MTHLKATRHLPRRTLARVVVAGAVLMALSSCGDSGEPKKNPISPPDVGPPPATTFTGYFGDSRGYSGPIDITIAAMSLTSRGPRMAGASRAPANLISAVAQIQLGPATTLHLSGWYDTTENRISLAGSPYLFFGSLDTLAGMPVLVATDNTEGIWGAFAAVQDTAKTARVHCGVATNQSRKLGVVGFTRVDTTLIGVAQVNFLPDWYLVQGVLQGSGNARTIQLSASVPGAYTLSLEGTFYMGTGTGGGPYWLDREPPGVDESGVWDTQPCN